LARDGTDGRDGLVAGWTKSNWEGQERRECRARMDMRPLCRQFWVTGLPFMATAGRQWSSNQPSIWCRQHGARQGQPVRSQRREHGCGKRWQSGVTASYGRDTDADEVQRSKELIMMGRRTRKLSVQHFTFAIATERSLAKDSIDPGLLPCLILRI
jgi:hypothetical protein